MFRSAYSIVLGGISLSVFLAAPHTALAADQSITIAAWLYPAPGREAEAEARLLQLVAYVRRVEPSTIYRLHRSNSEPATFLFYEVYDSQNSLDQHSKITLPAFRKEYGENPEGLWARPPMVQKFRELAQ